MIKDAIFDFEISPERSDAALRGIHIIEILQLNLIAPQLPSSL